ncbi:MAG: molybdopterin cofactor-binding domain-containing protein, partial [Streptosporangiaceae bacterium]
MTSSPAPSPSLAANPRLREWVDLSASGIVTIRPGKVEYGQGVWTALAQIAAEELDVGLDQVRVAGVSTSSSPDEGVTSGSRSIEDCGGALRQVCAQVRAAFLAAAAEKLGADPATLQVERGTVRAGVDQARADQAGARPADLSYWSLDEAALLDRAAQLTAAVKPPAQWQVAGRSAPRIDLPDKATGRPRFLHDQMLPGMLFGRVIRPPAPAATLDGVGEADLPAGVVVQVRDGSFLGVIAETDRAAVTAAKRLSQAARWTVRESLPDEDDLKGFLLSQPTEDQPVVQREDTESAAQVRQTRAAEFTRPFIAHGSMAPSCAIACWDGEQVSVWTHSQGVFPLRGALATGMGLDPAQVTVHHVEGAGVYGHNASDDAAADAVLLARAVPGRPVRVLWSREDELSWGPLGPAMLARLSAGLDSGGRIRTWRQDVWSNGFVGRPGTGGEPRLLALAHVAGGTPISAAPDGVPSGAMGATRNAVPAYDIPGLEVTRHRLLTMPLRTSSLRSLGAFLNVFAIESFMDELALAADADPVAFRLAHLSDPRARRVIEEAAAMSGWSGRTADGGRGDDGTGFGIAFARYKGTSGYCAAVAEVAADTSISLRRLWLAVDVGRVINPDGLINQVEGGAIQSASWALRERVRFDRTRITSVTWESYPILRFTEVPEVAVRIVAAPGEPPTGAGELAQGPVAGAIGNAVSDAIGVRVRDLPLTTEQVTRVIE